MTGIRGHAGLLLNSGTIVTWNPLDKNSSVALSGGNLVGTDSGSSAIWRACRATLGLSASAANNYFELFYSGSANSMPGIMQGSTSLADGVYPGSALGDYGYLTTGVLYTNGASSAYGTSYTAGIIIGVLLKNGKLYFSRNNVWQNSGDPIAQTGFAASGLTGTYYPSFGFFDNANTWTGRFTLTSFSYTPPAGTSSWSGS